MKILGMNSRPLSEVLLECEANEAKTPYRDLKLTVEKLDGIPSVNLHLLNDKNESLGKEFTAKVKKMVMKDISHSGKKLDKKKYEISVIGINDLTNNVRKLASLILQSVVV